MILDYKEKTKPLKEQDIEPVNKKQDVTTQKEPINKAKVSIKNLIRVTASKK